MRGPILLAAGGTGGHLFPAEALAEALIARGWTIHLATDHRAASYGHDFPAAATHFIASGTITRSPISAAKAVARIGGGFIQSASLLRRIRPAVAVGFGGYPTVPPILAAAMFRIPTIIHEQNAVFGRANRFLAPRVTRVATSFAEVAGGAALRSRMVQTGNPVRPAVIAVAGTPYPARAPGDPFRLLVFGGSQGAAFLSDVVPAAVALLPKEMLAQLRITQQCRTEDIGRVREAYERIGVAAELAPFFSDMPARLAASHAVICRSGASTCAELAVIGRPAIMIPLPHALDQDQKANASVLANAGGGWMIDQASLTPERLSSEIAAFIADPARLSAAASAAKGIGRPDAADRLADLVEQVAASKIPAAGA